MKFVVYEGEVPLIRPRMPRMKGYLDEFVNMAVKVVRVDLAEHEYANLKSAQSSIRSAIKRYALPICATIRKDDLYLIRTDM